MIRPRQFATSYLLFKLFATRYLPNYQFLKRLTGFPKLLGLRAKRSEHQSSGNDIESTLPLVSRRR